MESNNTPVAVLGSAIKMSGLPTADESPRVPVLGEDTIEVLTELGIRTDEIDRLQREGVI